MSNKNKYLQAAKNTKNDEFYTPFEAIEKELAHYKNHFKGKTVQCNCDDPLESNFCKYFVEHFAELGIKRLICTSYAYSPISRLKKQTKAYVLDIKEELLMNSHSPIEIGSLLTNKEFYKPLQGDGDFRSTECLQLLDQADIIVTNPPFSLFKEFFVELIKRNKKFLIIGNQNALLYKEVFPYIQSGLVWTGYQFGEMKFRVPQNTKPRKYRYWVDETGQKWRSLGNAMWLTNLDIDRIHEYLPVTKKYSKKEHPKYDLFDAIHVKTIRDIPYDYEGIMGVPITFINRFNPEQFEIIGEANHGSDGDFDLFKPTVKKKLIYKRILIKNKMVGRKIK